MTSGWWVIKVGVPRGELSGVASGQACSGCRERERETAGGQSRKKSRPGCKEYWQNAHPLKQGKGEGWSKENMGEVGLETSDE